MGLSAIVASWGLGPSWAWAMFDEAWGQHGRECDCCFVRLGSWVIRGRNRLGASLPWPLLLCATVMVMDRISLWL
jgi:hypothetical protein